MVTVITLQAFVTSIFSSYAVTSTDERLFGISLYLLLFVLSQPFQFFIMIDAVRLFILSYTVNISIILCLDLSSKYDRSDSSRFI